MDQNVFKGPESVELNGSVASVPVNWRFRTSTLIKVTGFDTSLPADDIKSALWKHFATCGEITDVVIYDLKRSAAIFILGEDALEKALALSGSDMGGCKVVAKAGCVPEINKNKKRIIYCSPFLGRFAEETKRREAKRLRDAKMATTTLE